MPAPLAARHLDDERRVIAGVGEAENRVIGRNAHHDVVDEHERQDRQGRERPLQRRPRRCEGRRRVSAAAAIMDYGEEEEAESDGEEDTGDRQKQVVDIERLTRDRRHRRLEFERIVSLRRAQDEHQSSRSEDNLFWLNHIFGLLKARCKADVSHPGSKRKPTLESHVARIVTSATGRSACAIYVFDISQHL